MKQWKGKAPWSPQSGNPINLHMFIIILLLFGLLFAMVYGPPDPLPNDTDPGCEEWPDSFTSPKPLVVEWYVGYSYRPSSPYCTTQYEYKETSIYGRTCLGGSHNEAINYARTWDSYASWPWKSDEPTDVLGHYEVFDQERIKGVPVTPLYIAKGLRYPSRGAEGYYICWSTHPFIWEKIPGASRYANYSTGYYPGAPSSSSW